MPLPPPNTSNDQLLLNAANDVVIAINNLTQAMQDFFPQLSDTTSSTATGGAATLPANPVGFIEVTIGGTARKLPFYSV